MKYLKMMDGRNSLRRSWDVSGLSCVWRSPRTAGIEPQLELGKRYSGMWDNRIKGASGCKKKKKKMLVCSWEERAPAACRMRKCLVRLKS